jgi:hypothetical protein
MRDPCCDRLVVVVEMLLWWVRGEGGTGPDPAPLCCYEALERNFYFFTNSRILSLWTHSDPFRLNRVS